MTIECDDNDYESGSSCAFSCPAPFRVNGTDSITCNAGKWDAIAPSCCMGMWIWLILYESSLWIICVKSEKSEVFETESHYPIIVSVLQTNESDVLFLQSDLGTLPSSTKTFNLGDSISKRYPLSYYGCLRWRSTLDPFPLVLITFSIFEF